MTSVLRSAKKIVILYTVLGGLDISIVSTDNCYFSSINLIVSLAVQVHLIFIAQPKLKISQLNLA